MYSSPEDHPFDLRPGAGSVNSIRRPSPSFAMNKTYTNSDTGSIYKPYRPEYATPDLVGGPGRRKRKTVRSERGICGMRRRVFWMIVVGVCLVILGAVGAVLGVMLGRKSTNLSTSPKNASAAQMSSSTTVVTTTITASFASPTSTSSPSQTSDTPSTSSTPFPTTGFLKLDCPSIDSTTYTSGSTNYKIHCNGTNYLFTAAAIEAYNTTTINDCMDKCTWFNSGGPKDPCVGITFQGNLTEAEKPEQKATCWLAATLKDPHTGTGNYVASAEIVVK